MQEMLATTNRLAAAHVAARSKHNAFKYRYRSGRMILYNAPLAGVALQQCAWKA
jgi:hypothetical protein